MYHPDLNKSKASPENENKTAIIQGNRKYRSKASPNRILEWFVREFKGCTYSSHLLLLRFPLTQFGRLKFDEYFIFVVFIGRMIDYQVNHRYNDIL